ncbi:hypothetical protein V8F20_007813 [Naviculisporaceae sp. PSN 640]
MRLQSRRRNLHTLSVAVLAASAFSTATAAGIPHQGRDVTPADCHGNVFPVLGWLRDSVVQLVFGRPARRLPAKGVTPAAALPDQYRDSIVVRFNITNPEEGKTLSKVVIELSADVWAVTPEFVDIRVRNLNKVGLNKFLRLLPSSLRQPTVLIPDLAAAVANTFPCQSANSFTADSPPTPTDSVVPNRLDGVSDLFFREYQPLAVIDRWMRLLESMFPTIVNLTTIGKSYEGRDIIGLRVGERAADTPGPRKTILITGGLHGREWISTSTVAYLLWSVITTHGHEQMITKLLQHFDIVFVPVLNPDGYEYTWQTDRLWRKSRQKTKWESCSGLDLDRAFGYGWEPSNDATPCSEGYGGDEPFQAVEAMQLAKWAKKEVETNNVKFIGFLDLHSYSQQVLYPYSYSCAVDPPNLENLEELAVGLAKAIRLSNGEPYSIASACEGAVARANNASSSVPRVEAAGGSAIDWFYHELKARYSYQIKLRDTGSYGFLLPKEQIIPSGEEMLNALKYFGDFLLGNNGIEKLTSQSGPLKEHAHIDLKRRSRKR